MWRTLAIVGILVGGLIQMSCKTVDVSEGTFFRPRVCDDVDVESVQSPYEDVRISVDDGVRLQVLLAPHPSSRAVLIHFGGNELRHCVGGAGADAQLRARFRRWASDHQVSVAFVNYRGYGGSGGHASLQDGARDALAVHDALMNDARLTGQPVIAYGQSLGATFAIRLAAERPVRALVLESSPTTARAVLANATPWYVKPFVRYRIAEALSRQDNADAIGAVSVPLLVLVGNEDRITPPRMAAALLKSCNARQKTLAAIPGHHGDLPRRDELWAALTSFLRTALA
jgi:pimeloyl-ACP methyl ester carboxylesterase